MEASAVVIAATLDTKGDEIAYVCRSLRERGRSVILIDCSVLGAPGIEADIPRDVVARAGGADLSTLQNDRNREVAIRAMVTGLEAVVRDLLAQGRVAAFLGVGGGTNASLAAAAFRALPFGLPKMLVSTVACGNTRPFVGIKDVILFHSVVDVLGLNALLRSVLDQAVAALDGMLRMPAKPRSVNAGKCIGVTAFGSTTAAATHALEIFEKSGFEVLTFHARGVGGEAMESLVGEGRVDGVLDLTTTEVADEIVGGICSAGPHRLEAAGSRGLPQVILPGAVDMVNFGPRSTVPERFTTRRLVAHTPAATLMRTTPRENVEIAAFIASKLNAAKGPTAVVMPLQGFSDYDRKGAPFFDPEADEAFRTTLASSLAPHIAVHLVDAHVNDRETIEVATDLLIRMILQP